MKSMISTPTGTINSIEKSDKINKSEANKFLTMFGNCETVMMPSYANHELGSDYVSSNSDYLQVDKSVNLYKESLNKLQESQNTNAKIIPGLKLSSSFKYNSQRNSGTHEEESD